ncbi:MAG TPA: sugar ABC transporter substrate-binding protein [Gammaproteobacteria bacterium]|nr:sugar ABC transporter substrate-binding protein [Gammaproteobacteria bacterium]
MKLGASPGFLVLMMACLWLPGCTQPNLVPATSVQSASSPDYLIGPGDLLDIFVWGNEEVSVSVPVRPDGRISSPLVEDMVAAGKTPTRLARDMERELARFLKDPLVTVIVREFIGPYSQQIRVLGEATTPKVLPYRENMSVLDVMIAVGGLTEFAAGNKATLVRQEGGERRQFTVRLDDLIRDGDITANVPVFPGDILIIPESWF